LLETFFVCEFYSSSPITGFLLAGCIGTTLYKNESPFVSLAKTQKRLDGFSFLFCSLYFRGGLKRKKNPKSCPENWKIREKLKVLFSVATTGTIWPIFFLLFVIIRMRFLCKEKLEKFPGKLENSGKTESAFFVMDMHNYFFLFCSL
jgi:hypothetical protein